MATAAVFALVRVRSVSAASRAPDACTGKKDLSLNGGGFALAEQCLGLGEGGLVREGGEEVACIA